MKNINKLNKNYNCMFVKRISYVVNNYHYILADYMGGLNYGVDRELYIRDMEILKAKPREGKITAEIYCRDIYKAVNKIKKEA